MLLSLVSNLDAGRFRSHIVLMRPGWLGDQLRAAGADPVILPSRRGYDIGFIRRLCMQVHHSGADLIHAHLPDAAAYACLTGALTRTPVVATYHGFPAAHGPSSRSTSLKLAVVRWLAARVVTVSSALRNELVGRAHFSAANTRTIHNGIDWSVFDRPFDPDRLRRELGLDGRSPVVGMVANLRPAKGYHFFVRAAARVAAAMPDVQFVAVGEPEEKLQRSLDQEIAGAGIERQFRFLGTRDNVPEILRILDVFVLSSLSEGMSIATVEAMGAGVPAVVTKSGGPEEIVTDKETGLLVPPGDDEALATGILRCLTDRPMACQMAEKGKADVRRRFALQTMVDQYAALYEECLC